MDALRLILLVIGVIAVAVIYFYNRQARQERRRTQEMRELFEARSEALDDIPELDRSAAVLPDGSEAPLQEEFARLSNLVAEQRPSRGGNEAGAHAHEARDMAAGESTASDTTAPRTSAPTGEELIIVCHIMAAEGGRLNGTDILAATARAGFQLGDRAIFHDLVVAPSADLATASPAPVLSLANALEPGTFERDTMDRFSSPGLTLFLHLPGPLEGRAAFERLLSKGRQLAEGLNAELCDETRSVLTPQTVNHLRERVEAFRFKQQMAELGKRGE